MSYIFQEESSAGLFRTIFMSTIINTSITPISTIITTSISPPFTIITTDIIPLRDMTTIYYYLLFMNIFTNRTRRNWWYQQSTMSTWVMEGRVSGMLLISTSPININSWSTISRIRVDFILRPTYTSTIKTRIINYTIAREIVASLLRPIFISTIFNTKINSTIERGRLDVLKRTLFTSSFIRKIFKTYIIINNTLVTIVGGILDVLVIAIF